MNDYMARDQFHDNGVMALPARVFRKEGKWENKTMMVNVGSGWRVFYLLLLFAWLSLFVLQAAATADTCSGYSVILTGTGPGRIAVIKAVRELTGAGLREAKEMVDRVPVTVGVDLPGETAARYMRVLEEAGGSVRSECSKENRVKPYPRPVPRPVPVPVPRPVDTRPPRVDIETDSILVKTVGDRITVRGVAEDNDKVASIIIYAQGRPVKTCAAWECWYGEEVHQAGPRRYHAEALDPAGNRGISRSLEFMVHPTARPGPSLNIRTDPYHPTNRDQVRFIAAAAHPSGVRDITIHVNGRAVRTCPGTRCEYTGGPYETGNLSWRVSARSRDGGETYGSENTLEIKAAAAPGHCSISGRAVGARADVARVFFISIYGPDNDRNYRMTKSFSSDGDYRFSGLPDGRYRLSVDTRGDIAVGVYPRTRIVQCRGTGAGDVDFEFR